MKLQETTDYLVKIVWQNMVNTYNVIAAEYGLTQSIGYMLINIPDEGVTVSELAKLIGVKVTSLSRILQNMEQNQLILRTHSVADKRVVFVKLTPLGFEKRSVAKNVVKSFNQHIDSKLSAKELVQIQSLLRKINKLTLSYKPGKYEKNY